MRFPKSVFGGWHLNCPRQQTVRPAVHASEGAQQRHWSERDCQKSGWAKAGAARATAETAKATLASWSPRQNSPVRSGSVGQSCSALTDGSCIRLRPRHPNHVWSDDFVEDRTQETADY